MNRITPDVTDIILHGLKEAVAYDGAPLSEHMHLLSVVESIMHAFVAEGIQLDEWVIDFFEPPNS